MSIKLIDLVYRARGIPSTPKAVLVNLAWHENQDGRPSSVSIRTASDETGCTDSTISKVYTELKYNDLIVNEVSKGGRTHTTKRRINPGGLFAFIEEGKTYQRLPRSRHQKPPATRGQKPPATQGVYPETPRHAGKNFPPDGDKRKELNKSIKKEGKKDPAPLPLSPGGQEERDTVLVEVQRLAGRTVSGRVVIDTAEAMLRQYEPHEIVAAFAEHVHGMDDFAMRRNVETFFTAEGGGWLVLLQRRKLAAEQKATEELMTRQAEQIRQEAEEETRRLEVERAQAKGEVAFLLGEDDEQPATAKTGAFDGD